MKRKAATSAAVEAVNKSVADMRIPAAEVNRLNQTPEPAAVQAETKDRLNLTLSVKTREQLETLKRDLDADSLSEVVRRAVQCLADQVDDERDRRRQAHLDRFFPGDPRSFMPFRFR